MNCEYEDKIFNVNKENFSQLTLDIFRFQVKNNPVYGEFVHALGKKPDQIDQIEAIPFLPIRFFKTHSIKTTEFEPQLVFQSSGTTDAQTSRHLVRNASLYQKSFLTGFSKFYGPAQNYCILGLLPSYLERQHSSLIYMVQELINQSDDSDSGFYLYNYKELKTVIKNKALSGKPTLLIGVSFALLDFIENEALSGSSAIIMETGGMKGRKTEITRMELHEQLQRGFGVSAIHAEYGMTELLSQAYSKGSGIYETMPWMKIGIREEDDPLTVRFSHPNSSIRGGINVIDLANIYSCSFIATDDQGILLPDGRFQVQGRLDNADIRGCSLLIQ